MLFLSVLCYPVVIDASVKSLKLAFLLVYIKGYGRNMFVPKICSLVYSVLVGRHIV